MVVDSEIESKIKRVLADNVTKEYKDESMKNKAPANAATTIDRLSRDRNNESNNTNDKTNIERVAETMLKAVCDTETRQMPRQEKTC